MTRQIIKANAKTIVAAAFLVLFSATAALAQTTGFTYQGRLTDGGTPANGNYDLQFVLWDSASGGAQVGATQTLNAVSVSAGIFTVTLDFGANGFTGANRFLEISARPSGAGSLTLLTPREQITSTPYAVRSLNAASADTATNATSATNASQLGGVAANQYVLTNDPRLTGGNYIQNTNAQQASSNFNISGNGTVAGALSANIVNVAGQYNIGGSRVLSIPGGANTFAGSNTGSANAGTSNSFFGNSAGAANTSGSTNSFFGERAGTVNSTGYANAFFGSASGVSNTGGATNAFFGTLTGFSNTNGTDNSYFGTQAGYSNQTGNGNSFFGRSAGFNNTADGNSFFGALAGQTNTSGDRNSFFGFNAGALNLGGSNNTFVGYKAGAGSHFHDNSFFGASAGVVVNGGVDNSFFGSQAGNKTTEGNDNAFFGVNAGADNLFGSRNSFFGMNSGQGNEQGHDNTAIGNDTSIFGNISFATAIGAGVSVNASNTIEIGRPVDGVYIAGTLVLLKLGTGGNIPLCRGTGQISTCSSSLRYKKDLAPFTRGLALLNRLKPITFTWKSDNTLDLGFGAEDVAAVEPLLVTHNDNGEIEGVKYDRITAVLVNAVKEQQQQIQQQQKQIASLKQIVCRSHPRAAVCK